MEKFKFIMSGLWSFLAPLIVALFTSVGQALVVSVAEAVKVGASLPAGTKSDDRYEAAFNFVKEDMANKNYILGTDFAVSLTNAAIEAAVVKLKAETE